MRFDFALPINVSANSRIAAIAAALKAFSSSHPFCFIYIYYVELVARSAQLLLPGGVEPEHAVCRENSLSITHGLLRFLS